MAPAFIPGLILRHELTARKLCANLLALDLGVSHGRTTDILSDRAPVTVAAELRRARYFGNGTLFWINLQGQFVPGSEGQEMSRKPNLRKS